MSHKSLPQRMLSGTSLESKCLLWFGAALFVFVFAAFWAVDNIAEKLVTDTTREKGRDFVDSVWLKVHWETWETDPTKKEFLKQMIRDLPNQQYEYKILAIPDESGVIKAMRPGAGDIRQFVFPPDPGWELRRLESLRDEWTEQLAEWRRERTDPEINGDNSTGNLPGLPKDIQPKFAERRVQGKEFEEYHYYQPAYFKPSCNNCHTALKPNDALPAAEAAALLPQGPPFRVVKVMMKYTEIRQAINWTRAILITVAILTVVLGILALYVVVRYMVVKPLQHLRDVSDQISRGNTSLRADMHTNDEIEELGEAFNRMLHHLIDAQEKLREANETLDVRVAELARANIQLYEMNRLRSDFLASMSHELRTPLNSIIGFSDVLQGMDALDNKQKRFVRNIQNSGRQLLDMINDILDLAKMESGKMEVRTIEFSIEHVVHAQCDAFRKQSEDKNIELSATVASDLPPMVQDQSKILQIFSNLVSNAIKFTPEGGRIHIEVKRDESGRLEMNISDTGIGIAEEDRDVIFEKFRQGRIKTGDTLTREYSGTGLGLSIVKEICVLLGGEIGFVSELGKGSTFTVRLPWVYQPPKALPYAARHEELSRARWASPHETPSGNVALPPVSYVVDRDSGKVAIPPPEPAEAMLSTDIAKAKEPMPVPVAPATPAAPTSESTPAT